MPTLEQPRPPFPPFTTETATQKVRMAEDAWNSRDPERCSLAYSPDSVWRNRSEFLAGRDAIRQFLARKWATELDYRLVKELWSCQGNRMQFASPMNGTTTAASGIAPTATRTGSSTNAASCSAALRASMTCPSRRASASSIGRSVGARTTTLGSRP
jgi:hypothetical protein